jgi:DNA-binding SARP family transcriptional activator
MTVGPSGFGRLEADLRLSYRSHLAMPAHNSHSGDDPCEEVASPWLREGREDARTLDSVAVARSLDGLRESVQRRGEPALAAILGAAERVAEEWLQRRDRASRRRGLYEEALAAEEQTAEQLSSVLRTLAELAETGDPAPRWGTRTSGGVRGWLGRRRSGRPAATGYAAEAHRSFGPGSSDAPERDEKKTKSDGLGVLERQATQDPVPADPSVSTIPSGPQRVFDAAVFLLGDFCLLLRGRPLDCRHAGKSQRLIRYLLAHHTRQVPKDVLIEVFWPTAGPTTGRRNLHQAVYMIRKAVRAHAPEMQLIIHDNDTYAVNPDLDIWSDAEEFERSIAIGRTGEDTGDVSRALEAYRIAERCYRGDFLEDSPYEDWALNERDRLRLLYLEVANRLGDLLVAVGELEGAFQIGQRLLRRDPCDEHAHQRAMRCFAAAGQRSLVAQQYRACADALERSLALEPSPETTEVYESLIGD